MPGGMYFLKKLGDVIPFGFGSNDTSGSGDDGATPVAVVMRDGAADNAAPVHEPTPVLLTHPNVPAGSYRLLITASVGNGYVNGESYLVYCSLAVDAQNPTGFLGGFSLSANGGIALRGADNDNLKTLSDKIIEIKAKTDNLPEVKRKNVAFVNPFQFFMEDANGDGVSGLTVTGIKILDGVRSAISGTISEISGSNGWYSFKPSAAETNGDHVSYEFSGIGASDTIVEFWTTA